MSSWVLSSAHPARVRLYQKVAASLVLLHFSALFEVRSFHVLKKQWQNTSSWTFATNSPQIKFSILEGDVHLSDSVEP